MVPHTFWHVLPQDCQEEDQEVEAARTSRNPTSGKGCEIISSWRYATRTTWG